MLLAAEHDPELKRIIEGAALVVPESSGILLASHKAGQPLKEFTPGIDFMLSICRMAAEKGHPAFFLGSAPGVAEEVVLKLLKRLPGLKIVGSFHGYFK